MVQSRNAVRPAMPILEGERPLISSARTAMVLPEEALVRTLPTEYRELPLKQSLDHLLGVRDLRAKESTVLDGVKKQMTSRNYIVQVNGRNANLAEPTSRYITKETIKNDAGQEREYDALNFVIEAVETGGRY